MGARHPGARRRRRPERVRNRPDAPRASAPKTIEIVRRLTAGETITMSGSQFSLKDAPPGLSTRSCRSHICRGAGSAHPRTRRRDGRRGDHRRLRAAGRYRIRASAGDARTSGARVGRSDVDQMSWVFISASSDPGEARTAEQTGPRHWSAAARSLIRSESSCHQVCARISTRPGGCIRGKQRKRRRHCYRTTSWTPSQYTAHRPTAWRGSARSRPAGSITLASSCSPCARDGGLLAKLLADEVVNVLRSDSG